MNLRELTRRTLLRLAALGAVAALAAPGGPAACGRPPDPVGAAIARGVRYLVQSQKRDGSWGSPASNLYDIYAPIPGSYQAFQVAVTALAVSALAETGDGVPGAARALRRGTDFLLEHHAVRRISPDTLYNVWAHAYALEAFARLLPRERDEARRAALRKAAGEAVERLVRFEYVDGGWGYYDFDIGAKHPGPGATSFTTAACLVALRMAADQGVEVPERLVDRALSVIERCRMPGNSFAYSFDLRYWPQAGINKVKGSLARTPACLLALRTWGREVPQAKLEQALSDLDRYGHFLRIARKYPTPHESWYQNSGYFCFYGYCYASRLVALLPEGARAAQAEKIASRLVPLQETDGSWWDYQLYGYHKAYGTGYVLLALAAAR